MQKFHIGDVVQLNNKQLPRHERHQQLLPGLTGVVQKVHCSDAEYVWYEVQWDSPNKLLKSGWWVFESHLDFAEPPPSINIKALL